MTVIKNAMKKMQFVLVKGERSLTKRPELNVKPE